jgi:integrase
MSKKQAITDMHDETGLELRDGVYYFRMKMPADLRSHVKRNEVRVSLRTKDKAQAKRLNAERRAQQFGEWDALRERIKNGPRRTIAPEETQRILARFLADHLGYDESERMRGRPPNPDEPSGPSCIGGGEIVSERDRAAIARGEYSESLRMAAEDWLTEFGYELEPGSDDYLRFIYAFAQASSRAADAQRRRSEGKVVPTPAAPPPAPQTHAVSLAEQPVGTRRSLRDALPIWIRLKKPAASTVEIYDAALARFERHYSEFSVGEITKSHIRRHVERLQSDGKSPKTIEKEHGALRALFTVAEHEEWIAANPAKGVMLPSGNATKMRSYTPDEVAAIFRSPVFTKGLRPVAGKGEAAYWVPLLLLFTAARREEVCQLTVDHVRESEGIAFLAIDPREDSGRVKTEESRRAVPLHPNLVRLGFLDYVEQRRCVPGGRLFPLLNKPNKRGQVGAKWGDWWARYVRNTVGIKDPRVQPAHGFRHLFITEGRRAKIPEGDLRRLVGHASDGPRDAHSGYGEHLVSALAEEVARIAFRGVDLSHLYQRHSLLPRPSVTSAASGMT